MTDENPPVPMAMHTWLLERARGLEALLAEIERAGRREDRDVYVPELLQRWAEVEADARKAVHLLTAYALRERVISATEVARRSGVTLTAAQSRLASRTGTDVWDEVFGSPG